MKVENCLSIPDRMYGMARSLDENAEKNRISINCVSFYDFPRLKVQDCDLKQLPGNFPSGDHNSDMYCSSQEHHFDVRTMPLDIFCKEKVIYMNEWTASAIPSQNLYSVSCVRNVRYSTLIATVKYSDWHANNEGLIVKRILYTHSVVMVRNKLIPDEKSAVGFYRKGPIHK